MCDFQKRKALDYHGDGKKMRFVKKSRWETPIPKSTSYWNEVCNNIEKKVRKPPLCNSRQLRRVLPLKSYNLVAPILNMPQWQPKKYVGRRFIFAKGKDGEKDRRDRRRSSEIDFDLFVHPPSATERSLRGDSPNSQKLNPYALFLVKPRRKVVTWRPLKKKDLKGYNPDATLSMRASKITDKICHDFCEWLRGLTGSLERIDEEVLKDMFQIIFTADACKSMQVIIKEMPTVPRPIALIRNRPSATELEMTRKELRRDIKIEKKPKKTFAFGRALPKHLRFVPPQNQVEKKWFLCENVPQELESMDLVWNGIKHLKSVKGFVNWLKANTNLAPPDTLDIKTDALSVSRFSQEDMITQIDFEGRNFY
ncbi:uncharacterized protein LOC117171534 [Belonocnema kinseyi]|uniref:uncharacterized protein LOC117171534 n=1 Tax=Belonocnema kinseyi TaxID=2817044 RepID=UPI00143CD7B4|nr:uncharacterized protein LOC117171534 [Belonocnema kinseyi]XP_033214822.1 uncharacterized protein LOC117171534 [Belonocnema kinseyi]XP_033214823.1 uncharacterized protein LOC117171534 [Belonocnema kinseyi]